MQTMKPKRQILTPEQARDLARELTGNGILFEVADGRGIFTGKKVITVFE